jgi:hypothetical protein
MMEGVYLRNMVSTYRNITMYPPVQLFHANKKLYKKEHFYE